MAWRRAFALSVYLYVRLGELDALMWDDVDLVHGVIHVHRSTCGRTGRLKEIKTGETRRIPIEPALLPLLEAMQRETDGRGKIAPMGGIADDLARHLLPEAGRGLARGAFRAGRSHAQAHDVLRPASDGHHVAGSPR